MEIELKEIHLKPYLIDETDFEYFKQFNAYTTIDCENYMYYKNDVCKCNCSCAPTKKIFCFENTLPRLKIVSAKLVTTIEGTSIEGQNLTGKKLVISGFVDFRTIIYYLINDKKYMNVINTKIPFSTFIIIPQEICQENIIRLRYLIEDISMIPLSECRIFASATVMVICLD